MEVQTLYSSVIHVKRNRIENLKPRVSERETMDHRVDSLKNLPSRNSKT